MKPFGERSFEGFETFEELRASAYEPVPKCAGIYQVLWSTGYRPRFLNRSPAGWFKGRDPTVPIETLERKWVDRTACVYIGKAGGSRQRATLRSRISQFERFGRGKPVAHWGGRYIWQVVGVNSLLVCWLPTPKEFPYRVERKMLIEFQLKYGCLPFANLRLS
jgi:hypothetical protein